MVSCTIVLPSAQDALTQVSQLAVLVDVLDPPLGQVQVFPQHLGALVLRFQLLADDLVGARGSGW